MSSSVHSLPHAYFPPEFIFGSMHVFLLFSSQHSLFLVDKELTSSFFTVSVVFSIYYPSQLARRREELHFQSGTIDNTRFEIEFEEALGTLLIHKEQFCNWIILFNALFK